MDAIEIIALPPTEWEKYKALRLRALQEEPQAYLSTYEKSRNDPDEKWKERLSNARDGKTQWLVFAKEKETLIGMIGAFIDERGDIEIIALYVVKEARGKGVGKKLMDEILVKIQESRKGRRVLVSANEEQEAAVTLYKQFGFSVIQSGTYVLGDRKEHTILLLEQR